MARKKGLPFVVQPRLKPIIDKVGTEESGIIEIERKGYLTVSEKSLVQGVSSGDDGVRALFGLAGRIAQETGKQQSEVAQDIMVAPVPEYLIPYQEEIGMGLSAMLSFQDRSVLVQAAALLICRVDESWTIEQTMELHPDLIDGLANLYQDEENKAIDLLEKSQKANVATKGKP